MRYALLVSALFGCALSAGPAAFAAEFHDDYPVRPVRMVVAQAAGSPIDAMSRVVAGRLGEALGRETRVDNRAGADGILGGDLVAHSEPDGYTLLCAATASQVIVPQLHGDRVTFDPFKDFAPVSLFALIQNVLVVSPEVPFQSVRELIAYGKEHPGKLHWASAGSGRQSHLAGMLFAHMTGIEVRHVRYKGNGASLGAVMSGESQVAIVPGPSVMSYIRAGRVRALAIAGEKRSTIMPQLPTLLESGVRGYVSAGWAGLIAPGRTPQAILDRLHAAMVKAMNDPRARMAMARLGAEPVATTPAEFAAVIQRDWNSFGEAIRLAGLRAR